MLQIYLFAVKNISNLNCFSDPSKDENSQIEFILKQNLVSFKYRPISRIRLISKVEMTAQKLNNQSAGLITKCIAVRNAGIHPRQYDRVTSAKGSRIRGVRQGSAAWRFASQHPFVVRRGRQ